MILGNEKSILGNTSRDDLEIPKKNFRKIFGKKNKTEERREEFPVKEERREELSSEMV